MPILRRLVLLGVVVLGATHVRAEARAFAGRDTTEQRGPEFVEPERLRPRGEFTFSVAAAYLDHGPSARSLEMLGYPADVETQLPVVGMSLAWCPGDNVVGFEWQGGSVGIDAGPLFRLEGDFHTFNLYYGRTLDVGPRWFHIVPRGSAGYGTGFIDAISGPDYDSRSDEQDLRIREAGVEADGIVYRAGAQVRFWFPRLDIDKNYPQGRIYLALAYDYRFARLDISERFSYVRNAPAPFTIFDDQDEVDFSGHFIGVVVGLVGIRAGE